MAWEISSAEKSENLDECLGKALDMFSSCSPLGIHSWSPWRWGAVIDGPLP